jgi:ABC-type transporter Mla subunit MlaD
MASKQPFTATAFVQDSQGYPLASSYYTGDIPDFSSYVGTNVHYPYTSRPPLVLAKLGPTTTDNAPFCWGQFEQEMRVFAEATDTATATQDGSSAVDSATGAGAEVATASAARYLRAMSPKGADGSSDGQRDLAQGVKDVTSATVESANDAASRAAASAVQVAQSAAGLLRNLTATIASIVSNSTVAEDAKSKINSALDNINAVAQKGTDKAGSAMHTTVDAVHNATNAISSTVDSTTTAAQEKWNELTKDAKDAQDALGDAVVSASASASASVSSNAGTGTGSETSGDTVGSTDGIPVAVAAGAGGTAAPRVWQYKHAGHPDCFDFGWQAMPPASFSKNK